VNSSPCKVDEAELQPLRRLIHADKCFRTIMRLVKFLESAGLPEDEEAYLPIMAGICFTYAQPFWGNDGLGPLPQKFREFPNQERFDKIHTALLSGREWLYEHVGLESIFTTSDKKGRIGKVTITLQPGGGIVFDEEDLRWSQQELREIADLCRLQSNRLAPDIKALITDISAGKKYKLGSYILGENFP
jgi:hypothetical protein